jgi:hypothetical protein
MTGTFSTSGGAACSRAAGSRCRAAALMLAMVPSGASTMQPSRMASMILMRA